MPRVDPSSDRSDAPRTSIARACGGVLAGAALLAFPDAAYACEKCFGASGDEATIQAIVLSMATLLAMVGIVWGGIGMFFVNMRRRARMLEPGDLVVTRHGDLTPSRSNDSGS